MASWTKLRDGSYGIRSTEELKEGWRVTVAKKDGGTSEVNVGRVIWQGADKFTGAHVWLATVASQPRRNHMGRSRHECDECGEFVTPGTICWETGCRH